MQRVLLSQVPENIAEWIQIQLGTVRVLARGDFPEARQAIERDSWDLVLLQHVPIPDGEAQSLQLLEILRRRDAGKETPVIYVLDAAPSRLLMEKLVDEFRVERILVHPLEPEELLSEISRLLRLAPRRSQEGLSEGLQALWQKYLPLTLERLEKLEALGINLLEGSDTPEQHAECKSEAHKLAGSLGTFGYPRGSTLASRLETMLAAGLELDGAPEYSELLLQLREIVAGPPMAPAENQSGDQLQQVLLLDVPGRPTELPVRERRFELIRCDHPGQATTRLEETRPTAIVVHLGAPQELSERLEFLRTAARRHPDLSLVALLSDLDLEAKAEALRHGAQYLVDAEASRHQLEELLEGILKQQLDRIPRILVLDDDPVFNELVERCLSAAGMRVESILSPKELMDSLHSFLPDLLIVDINLPVMSGYEVCRLLRGLPRWQTLPLLLITAEKQPDTVVKVFRAGADDFVAKPFVGPELVARIRNKLARFAQLADRSATDSVTGLVTWNRARPRLRSFLDLARRNSQQMTFAVLSIDGLDALDAVKADRAVGRLGQTLANAFRGEDTVSRYHGDRILIGFFGMRTSDGLERLNGLLLNYTSRGYESFSAGLSTFPKDGDQLDDLVSCADRALEKAQQEGGARIVAGEEVYSVGSVRADLADVGVVEDDALLAPLILHALENRGYRTFWLRDGLEASRKLTSSPPGLSARLLLLDIDLPGISGYHLLRQLKEAGRLHDTKVILLTARTSQSDVLKGLEAGAVDHVPKPFSLPVLLEKVRQTLKE